MVRKCVVAGMTAVMLCSTVVFPAPAELKMTKGRIAVSHDGNAYDKDDTYSMAMDWAVMAAFGCQQRFVHLHHSVFLNSDDPLFHVQMTESARGWNYFPGYDSSMVFDAWVDIDKTVAHFKVQADRSAAEDKLYFLLAGPMHVPYLCIQATAKDKRPFIHCISHSSANEAMQSGVPGGKRWADIKSTFGVDRVVCEDIPDQSAILGGMGHARWSFLETGMTVKEGISLEAWKWLLSRDWKGNGDCSDNIMTWYVLTGKLNPTTLDYQERFQNPLPLEGKTSIASPSAKSAGFSGNPLAVSFSQNDKVLDVSVKGMKGNGSSVGIYDLLSRQVCKTPIRNGSAQISLDRGTMGSYIMTVESQGQKVSKQILLK